MMTMKDKVFTAMLTASTMMILLAVCAFLGSILMKGVGGLTLDFLLGLPNEIDAGGGIGPFVFNSLYVMLISLMISIPIGVGAGIFLSEYAPKNRTTEFVKMSVESLASVPSIVFGLFGMAVFVDYYQIGLTILGGGVTLAMLNLPVITRVTESAMQTVPKAMKEGSYALGANKFQTITRVSIPFASDAILTGIGLAAGRAFGESAVILLTAGTSTSGMLIDMNLFSPGETLAVHLWYIQSEAIVPDAAAIADRSAAVLVLAVFAFGMILRIPSTLKMIWRRA